MRRTGGQQRFKCRRDAERWIALRREVLHAARYQCAGCGRVRPVNRLEVDHVVPIHRGGDQWDRGNLQVLCKSPCHRDKTRAERRQGTYAAPVRRREWAEFISELL